MWYAQCPACFLWIALDDDMFTIVALGKHLVFVHPLEPLSKIAFTELKTRDELRPEEIYDPMRIN